MIDLEKLLRLRIVVGRFGELDNAGWWNTKGQMGRLGATVLRRGFPRTYRFAQARSVFAVAAQRCDEVFNPPGCVTLWKLPEAVEEDFDARWEYWLDHASDWNSFFERIETLGSTDLVEIFRSLELVTEAELDAYARLRRSAEGRAVPLPDVRGNANAVIAMLALGFARGEPGALAVPYIKWADT
ncbi:hypothetical protein OKW40_003520 [Paraburkholderia sp. RAU6.4a]|uniref:BrxE family protein n=1 Tax=Paraburkholderia sp. RAU6.4a TaxID=2991067 RepID=UPI003D236035